MTADPLLKWRAEFPILSRCNYLISNSLGAMPRGVYDSLQCFTPIPGPRRASRLGAAGWFELPQTVGDIRSPR